MQRDEATLVDLVTAARRAVTFAAGLEMAAFVKDEKTQSAVLHQLLVLGEAAKRVSDTFKAAHPDVPWKQMAGMRDRLIHGYDDVDLDEVWKTIASDLPSLIDALAKITPTET